MDSETVEELDSDAEDFGFDSRADFIRHLIETRDTPNELRMELNESQEEVDRLQARVGELQAKLREANTRIDDANELMMEVRETNELNRRRERREDQYAEANWFQRRWWDLVGHPPTEADRD